jgi:hypothetical protein
MVAILSSQDRIEHNMRQILASERAPAQPVSGTAGGLVV